MVRKRGFEPPRPCGHKLLRLARLPVPPLPHEEERTTGLETPIIRERRAVVEPGVIPDRALTDPLARCSADIHEALLELGPALSAP
jgi:hypothetical protein